MGTRGAWGFYRDGVNKIMYNQYDSYPRVLGDDILQFCRTHTTKELNVYFEKLQAVEGNPTKEQIEYCQKHGSVDLRVSGKSTDDWYCLLRGVQGNPESTCKLGFFEDSQNFLNDSLFCEWGYLINLDTEELEIYRGFQKVATESRYAIEKPERGYWHCRHVMSIPLKQVKDINIGALETQIEESE